MVHEDDLSWFAGILDAEGSFGLRRHSKRKSQVLAVGSFGMADRETVERAKKIAEELYGAPLTTHRRPPTRKSKQPFFCFNMVAKKELYGFVGAIMPFLRIKRTEALLQYDFLARASKKRHVGTDHDFWLCEMSRRLKDADPDAERLVKERVREDRPEAGNELAWLAGYTDGDGSISMASGTRSVLMDYGAMNPVEAEKVRGRVSALLGGRTLPILTPRESKLSDAPQWRLDLREVEIVMPLLTKLRPHLIAKREQAELAMSARATGDVALRERIIRVIKGLNNYTTTREEARRFLSTVLGP